jgi:hypothetical protein
MIAPAVITHADWGSARRKHQVAVARLLPGGTDQRARYLVASAASAVTAENVNFELRRKFRVFLPNQGLDACCPLSNNVGADTGKGNRIDLLWVPGT